VFLINVDKYVAKELLQPVWHPLTETDTRWQYCSGG